MTTQSLHAVLGAGPAGNAPVAELTRREARVRHISRGPFDRVDDRVETVEADLSTPEVAVAATDGADVVHHAVNVAHHLQTELLPGIARSVLGAVRVRGARLAVLDTLCPYGARRTARPSPRTARGLRPPARAGSQPSSAAFRLSAHRDGEARGAIGRSADLFGPGVVNSTLGGAFFPAVTTAAVHRLVGQILGRDLDIDVLEHPRPAARSTSGS